MAAERDITILMPTYKRADMLGETLAAMARLEMGYLDVQFVVIDNNSPDQTEETVRRFEGQLPLLYLFEGRPGKNCALNKALDEVDLGRIVVFTDDDVVPRTDWLQAIAASCERHLEYKVFGGRVEPIWPKGTVLPYWAEDNGPLAHMFTRHDMGEDDVAYNPGHLIFPLGPNFWVRKEVFDGGRRYNEAIGPSPDKSYIMGSESSFLNQLRLDGYRMMYVAESYVGHHISGERLSKPGVRQRAFRAGIGQVYMKGIPKPDLYARQPLAWKALRLGAVVRDYLSYLASRMPLPGRDRFVQSVLWRRRLGYDLEALKVAGKGLDDKRSTA